MSDPSFEEAYQRVTGIRDLSEQKKKQFFKQQNERKSLKKLQELITMLSTTINSIDQRKELVRKYELLLNQKEEKELESKNAPATMSVEARRKLDLHTAQMGTELNEIRQEIQVKFNQNIKNDIQRIESVQESLILEFVASFARSERSIHKI